MAGPTSTTGLATNSASLDALRQSASRDPKAAIKETSKQLESLFMNELMKSMRSTTMSSGLFDNSGTEMGTQMLDQQYATQLSGLPGGLADMIARQLEKQMGGVASSSVPAAPGKLPAASINNATTKPHIPQKAYAEDFVRSHTQAADAAAAETGIPSSFILSQAALESGWGRKEIRNADGSSSHNVFGIKATADWKGATTEVVTTEYVNGQPRKLTQSFRAYASYEDSFRDWARMLKQSPRYAAVVERSSGGSAQAFAQGLQRAGYATDPQYADKLGRVINTTLRLQRSISA